MHMISYPVLHRPKATRTSTTSSGPSFTQMGAYSLSSAERGVALTREEFPAVNTSVAGPALPPCLKVSGNRFGGWHTVTLPPARRFPSAWSPVSKPSSSSAPTGGPPTSASQRSQMHTSTKPWPASTSFRTPSSRHTWDARLTNSSKLMASRGRRGGWIRCCSSSNRSS
jgi:hypothetical protein